MRCAFEDCLLDYFAHCRYPPRRGARTCGRTRCTRACAAARRWRRRRGEFLRAVQLSAEGLTRCVAARAGLRSALANLYWWQLELVKKTEPK